MLNKEKRLTTVQSGGIEKKITLYSPGTKVFFLHPTASWRIGEVISSSTKNVVVVDHSSNAEYTLKHGGDIHAVIENLEYQQEIDDLLHLSELHEATLLHNIQTRFSKNKIYTYTGPIVIALNPFQKMPNLYDEESIRGQKHSELPPHIFAVADQAYQSMLSNQENQSVLISGESGAGKTETTKLLMKYLAAVSGRNINTENVQLQIMEANPILEAFGNAKTLRNNNSSRFGRWITIQFDAKGCLTGAVILNYLLEKSRIVYQAKVLAGAKSSGLADKFRLKDIKSFNYLNQSGCTSIEGVDDAADFESLKNALSVMGILEEDQTALFKAIAAILHLGNVTFALNEKNENWNAAVIANPDVLKFVASLLGVDARALEHALVTRMNLIRGEYFEVPLDLEKARDARDSVAKAIYNEIFGWLVQRINDKIADYTSERFIGLLDSFEVNSFEQFCINLANEKLQQHYNRHTFKWEQEACYKEEMDYTKIEFVDNQACLDLIEKKLGILSLLDEESNFPKATDESFLEKLIQHHADNPYFSKTPKSTSAFSIKHYAAEVSYEKANFLEKNKDTLKDDIMKLLRGSTDPFLRSLMSNKNTKDSQSKLKKMTVSAAFKRQLDQLMEEIEKTAPHWIRCVKPNDDKQSHLFDGPTVLHQLRCAGVLETVRIRKSGYPIRMLVEDFAKRFALLHPGKIAGKSARAMCDSIINQLKISKSSCQLGLTRVFLRQEQFDNLDKMRGDKLNQPVIVIQRVVRGYLSRLKFKRGKAARKAWRGYYYSTRYQKIRAAALLFQTNLRRVVSAKQLKALKLQNKPANGIASPEVKRQSNAKPPSKNTIPGLDLGDNVTLRALSSIYELDSGLTIAKLENLEQGLLQALERVRELKDKAQKPTMTLRRKSVAILPVAPVSKPAPPKLKPSPSPNSFSSASSSSSSSNSITPSPGNPPTPQRKPVAMPQQKPPALKPSPLSPSLSSSSSVSSVAAASPLLSPPPQRKPPATPSPSPSPAPASPTTSRRPLSTPPNKPPPAVPHTSSSSSFIASTPPSSLPPPVSSSSPSTSSSLPPAAPPPPPISPRKPSKSSFFSKFKRSDSKPAAVVPSEPPPAYSSLPPPSYSSATAPSQPISLPVIAPNHPPGGFATRSRPAPARRNKNSPKVKAYQPPPGAMWTDDETSSSSPSLSTLSSPSPSPASPSPSKAPVPPPANPPPTPPANSKFAPSSKPPAAPLKSVAKKFPPIK